MKTIFIALFLIVFGLISSAQTITHRILFDVDQSKINQQKIDEVAQFILDYPNFGRIQISSYTDTTGSISHNHDLSNKRLEAAKKALMPLIKSKVLIETKSFGELHQFKKETLANQRKVDVTFTLYSTTTIKDLFKATSLNMQEYCINPNKDTIIRCDQGSLIHIQANSFKSAKNRCVTIQVKEALKKSDMVLENLSTMADGKILETGGMIYINAIDGKDTLSPLIDLNVMLPTDAVKPGMGIFSGERDAHSHAMNWTANNNSVLRSFDVMTLNGCERFRNNCLPCYLTLDQAISYSEEEARDACERAMINCLFDCENECEKCRFVFCRLARAPKSVKGAFDKNTRVKNQKFRECQRNIRGRKKFLKNIGALGFGSSTGYQRIQQLFIRSSVNSGEEKPNEQEQRILDIMESIQNSDQQLLETNVNQNRVLPKCNELDSLMKRYQVDDVKALMNAVNQPLMDQFGVNTIEALLDTLPKVNQSAIEMAYLDQKISYQDYKFYVFNTSKLGWANVDVFASIPEKDQVSLMVNVVPNETVDFKLIFKERAYVLPAKLNDKSYYFSGIPKGEEAYLVGLKYENGKPYLALKKLVVGEKEINPVFENLTLVELKERLKVIDF